MNQEIITLLSLVLFVITSILSIYNLLYGYRVKAAREKIGIALPDIIRKLFGLTIVLSFGLMVVTLIIFVISLISLRSVVL